MEKDIIAAKREKKKGCLWCTLRGWTERKREEELLQQGEERRKKKNVCAVLREDGEIGRQRRECYSKDKRGER